MSRICMLVHEYYPRDFRVRREAEALVRQGHQVDVFCLQNEGEAWHDSHNGVEIVRIPVKRHRGKGLAVYLSEYVAFFALCQVPMAARAFRGSYDIVHVHNPPDFLVLAAVPHRLLGGSKIVLDIHDRVPELYGERFKGGTRTLKVLGFVERMALRFADRVVTVHKPYGERLEAVGVEAERLAIVHNSADENLFPRGKPPLPPGNRPVRLIHHGTLMRRYGVDVLVEAIHLLGAPASKVQLDILGEGDLMESLRRQVSDYDLGSQVLLHGYKPLDELSKWIEKADLAIVPNRYSSFTDGILPTKLLEYVNMGRPVIVSRTEVVSLYFRDDSVCYVEPGSAEDLADAIARYLQDPGAFLAAVPEAQRDYDPISWPKQERILERLVAGLCPDPATDQRN